MYSGGFRFSPGFRACIAVAPEQVRYEGGEGAIPRQRGGPAAAFAPLSLWWRHNTLRRHHSDFSAPWGRSLPNLSLREGGRRQGGATPKCAPCSGPSGDPPASGPGMYMGSSGATIHTAMGRIGRNQLCPCGSGKKFKKCCGSPQPAPLTDPARVTEWPSLFGPEAAVLTSLLDSFARSARPRTYRIMPCAEYAALESIAKRNQVYWQEMLYRAHFGACVALMRLREWLHGSERALADGNVLMLAAGIRGFLEAAADTWQSFSDVPSSLADCHIVVRLAIKGEYSEQLALAPELENMLIHFAFARKLKPGEGPAIHSATTAKNAISAIEESAPAIGTVYAALCDYAHPAAASVFRFGEIIHSGKVTFSPQAGPEKTREILTLSGEVGRVALVLGAAPVVMTLKVLNSLAFTPVATPWADGVAALLSAEAAGGRAGGLALELAMHPLVGAVLLRTCWRDALMHDAKLYPPDVQGRQAVNARRGERRAVVGADGVRQTDLAEQSAEDRFGVGAARTSTGSLSARSTTSLLASKRADEGPRNAPALPRLPSPARPSYPAAAPARLAKIAWGPPVLGKMFGK